MSEPVQASLAELVEVSRRVAGASMLVVALSGCGKTETDDGGQQLLGAEGGSGAAEGYQTEPDATEEGAANEPELHTLGGSCSIPGQLGCSDASMQLVLVCGASETWDALETCPVGQVCDSRAGATTGGCAYPDAACASRNAAEPYCVDGATSRESRACTREGLEYVVEQCRYGCEEGWCASSEACYSLEVGEIFCRDRDAYQCLERGEEQFLNACGTPCVHGVCADADGPIGREFLMAPRPSEPCAGLPAGATACLTPFDEAVCDGNGGWSDRRQGWSECSGAYSTTPVDCTEIALCPFERWTGVDGEQVIIVPVSGLGDRVELEAGFDFVTKEGDCYPNMCCATLRVPAGAYVVAEGGIASVAEVGGQHSESTCERSEIDGWLVACGRTTAPADIRVCAPSCGGGSRVYVEVDQYDAASGSWKVPASDDQCNRILY